VAHKRSVQQVVDSASHHRIAFSRSGDALDPEADQQRPRGGDRVADREAGGVGLDEVVGVGAAALGRARDLPAAEVGLERRGGAVGEDDVVEEDADALGGPVAGVRDRDLDALPGVRREVDAPLLPAALVAARRVPGFGGAGQV